jgi:hypothetical protein
MAAVLEVVYSSLLSNVLLGSVVRFLSLPVERKGNHRLSPF